MGKKRNYIPNVGVKHYVNNKLKPRVLEGVNPPKPLYPLYVQITFRGKTNRVRSVLGYSIAEEDFESFEKENSSDLFIERLVIQRKVIELNPPETVNSKPIWEDIEYDEYSFELGPLIMNELRGKVFDLLDASMREKMISNERIWRRAKYNDFPPSPLTKSEFDEALKNYFPLSYDFNPEGEFLNPNRYISFGDRNDYIFNNFSNINFLSYFFSDYIPGFRELRDAYGPELWDIESYINKIQQDEKVRFITIDSWNTGEFDHSFMESWKNEEALLSIKKAVKLLRKENEDLNSCFTRYQPYSLLKNE